MTLVTADLRWGRALGRWEKSSGKCVDGVRATQQKHQPGNTTGKPDGNPTGTRQKHDPGKPSGNTRKHGG